MLIIEQSYLAADDMRRPQVVDSEVNRQTQDTTSACTRRVRMTLVIGRRGARAYAHRMQPPRDHSTLGALLEEQRALEERIHNLGSCAEDVLVAGDALLAFAGREDEAFSAVAPLLDPAAQEEFAAEHQQIADDLTLLEWLVRSTPDSPDVIVLTSALVHRMRQHIDRDGRLLARAAELTPWR